MILEEEVDKIANLIIRASRLIKGSLDEVGKIHSVSMLVDRKIIDHTSNIRKQEREGIKK